MEKIRPHKIIRSKRRTIALVISPDATLTVRAPFYLPISFIEEFIEKKSSWILRKISELEKRPTVKGKEYVSGEGFLYLGKTYRLRYIEDHANELVFKDAFLISKVHRKETKELFISWYKKEAEKKISERVAWYSERSGLKYKSINISNAQKRWGSCSTTGNLNFSWRLIMAPLSVIDYVVVHELVHLTEKNHSRQFWNKVKILFPGYQRHKKWLQENGHLLNV